MDSWDVTCILKCVLKIHFCQWRHLGTFLVIICQFFYFIFRLEKSRNLIDVSTNICKEQAQTIASLETKLKIGFENEHLLRDTLLQNDELKTNLSKINDEIKLKEEKYFTFFKFYQFH